MIYVVGAESYSAHTLNADTSLRILHYAFTRFDQNSDDAVLSCQRMI